MFRRDYLMRQVQELTEALRRIAGLQQQSRHVAALQEAGAAYRLFELDEGLLKYMDAGSLVRLLGHRARAEKLVALVRLEADSCEDEIEAQLKRQRATDLEAAIDAAGLA